MTGNDLTIRNARVIYGKVKSSLKIQQRVKLSLVEVML